MWLTNTSKQSANLSSRHDNTLQLHCGTSLCFQRSELSVMNSLLFHFLITRVLILKQICFLVYIKLQQRDRYLPRKFAHQTS